MKTKYYCSALVGFLIVVNSFAQMPSNGIRPGVLFQAGDTVKSARLGLQTIVPAEWEGVLPRDTEVFLLMSTNNVNGEIYFAANQNLDREGQIQKWNTGMDLGGGLTLASDGNITSRGEAFCSNGIVKGNKANTGQKVYVEARCSPFGFCITGMAMSSDAAVMGKLKTSLQYFIDNMAFTKPNNESPFVNFNWKKFLSNKILLNVRYVNTNKREDEVNLCGDGSFSSQLTRRGSFKAESKGYQGKKKGEWSVESKGDKAILTLTIPKMPPVTVNMSIRDEEVYVNGNRYFVGDSEKCIKK